MLVCASFIVVSCNKETTDMANINVIQTPKLSANAISLQEAQASFLKAVREPQSSVTNSTPLNLADFDPQWNEANPVNYVDTSGNMITVPTTVFLPRGYKKLVFLRYNGQTTFLVATVIGTSEYLVRKNGICTMNDFCGYIIYTTPNGVSTGGYALDNGVTTGSLIPRTTPRPEWTFLDQLLDEFTVTVTSSGGSSGPSFGGFNAMMYGNYANFMDNTFGFFSGNGGGGGDNSSMDGSTPPPVNANLCPTTFVVSDNPANSTKDMGVRGVYMPMLLSDGSVVQLGFDGLDITVPRINGQTGQVVSDSNAAVIAAMSINIAQGLLQLRLNRGEVASTQAAMKREFIKLATKYINEKSGLNPQPVFSLLRWEMSATRPLMFYRNPVTGCP